MALKQHSTAHASSKKDLKLCMLDRNARIDVLFCLSPLLIWWCRKRLLRSSISILTVQFSCVGVFLLSVMCCVVSFSMQVIRACTVLQAVLHLFAALLVDFITTWFC